MCKRLSLLAINSYLSWCGKRKRRRLPLPCANFVAASPSLSLSPTLSPSLSHSLFPSVCVSENVCKTLDLRKDKIMLCKTIKWHYLWPVTPSARPSVPPPTPLTAHAKWCVSIRNCCARAVPQGFIYEPY